ncbi:hypothetical protein [Roseisolibacter agri]|uniref:Lipoprotein n=1 Tax=Roseisolibacter agri TaxID=2014610 RepID=A0AA37QDX1_9BACT|nr:hypothetical protein [Roseisolibacter agri]GLC28532.1 hypothetical protein rosag_50450 [Roseisolibacter agri]
MRYLVLPAVLLAAACAGDPATREQPAADSAAAPPPAALPPDTAPRRQVVAATSTSIQITPSVVAGGGQFVVRFSIRNDNADTVRMTQSCDAPAIFRIRHAEAAPESPPLEASSCRPGETRHVVPPGAELVLQLPSLAQAGRPPRPLPPGLYVVEAKPNVFEIDGRPIELRAVSGELRVR